MEGNNEKMDKFLKVIVEGELKTEIESLKKENYEFDKERKENFEKFFSNKIYKKYKALDYFKDTDVAYGHVLKVVKEFTDEMIEISEDPISYERKEVVISVKQGEEPEEKIMEIPKEEEKAIEYITSSLSDAPVKKVSEEKTLEILEEVSEERKKDDKKLKKPIPPYDPTERKIYCLWWSREHADEVTGGDRCRSRGCDIYAVLLVGIGRKNYKPEDFPKVCEYCTADKGKALMEAKRYREEKKASENLMLFARDDSMYGY